MLSLEGRGFLLRRGYDTPYAAWITASQLDHVMPIQGAPWVLIRTLGELVQVFPGGLALLWDLPIPSFSGLSHEARAAFWSALGHMPGLSFHIKDAAFAAHLDGPVRGWFHAPVAPTGAMGTAWRQGLIGWVPEPGAAWTLPGLGKAEGPPEAPPFPAPGCLWGELILSVGALSGVRAEDVAPLLGDAQAQMERDLSLRMSALAWPSCFPFQRRSTAWRISLVGGREYRMAGGTWEEATDRLSCLVTNLTARLRTPVQAGPCADFLAASLLGHQAMREGLPWRASLPIPPASPTFTPGYGADPREPSSLESRIEYPIALARLTGQPPLAWLRTFRVPDESAVMAFLRGQTNPPAIRWIPGDMPTPGPHSQERPWASASAFPPLVDVTQALQQCLFDDLEG
jgi:hypothetical protein